MGPLQRQVLRTLRGAEILGVGSLTSDEISKVLTDAGFTASTASVAAAIGGMSRYKGRYWIRYIREYSGEWVTVGRHSFKAFVSTWFITEKGVDRLTGSEHAAARQSRKNTHADQYQYH